MPVSRGWRGGRRSCHRTVAAGAVDAEGGGPLGEDLVIAAEAVFDGGVEAFDEVAGLFDEGPVVGVVADVIDAVVSLLGLLALDGGEDDVS